MNSIYSQRAKLISLTTNQKNNYRYSRSMIESILKLRVKNNHLFKYEH